MPRKILNDKYLLEHCKIYRQYPMVEIPHYKSEVPKFTSGMTSKAMFLVNNKPQQRPQNPVAEAMSSMSTNQRAGMVLEVAQQLTRSVSDEDWLRGFRFEGFSETSSEGGPDEEELAEMRREAPQVAAFLRAVEEGGTMPLMPPRRPTGMPESEGVRPTTTARRFARFQDLPEGSRIREMAEAEARRIVREL